MSSIAPSPASKLLVDSQQNQEAPFKCKRRSSRDVDHGGKEPPSSSNAQLTSGGVAANPTIVSQTQKAIELSSPYKQYNDFGEHSSKDNENRVRTTSDSWQLWNAVSPLLSANSWFESSDSFHSIGSNRRLRAMSSHLASNESRRLVHEYDSSKTPTLQQHEQYKHLKWGEDEFCEFDLDTSEIDIDLSLADSIKLLPLTDTVAQCVKSYSAFLGRFNRNNEGRRKFSQLPPLKEDSLLYESSSSESIKASQSYSVLEDSNSDSIVYSRCQPRHDSTQSVGELAIPKAVQEVFDFAVMLSRSAGSAIGVLIRPTCPKRRKRVHAPPPDASPLLYMETVNPSVWACQHRKSKISHRKKHRNANRANGSEGSGDELQCAMTDSFAVCPRRAVAVTTCPKRDRSYRSRGRRSLSESASQGFAATSSMKTNL